ncbi:MAG: diadenylate cyclase CdaA [Deltaproteobacteria bacterium]|nr:diadenylate cyclase CdaA [Deltaproteobacteria bacterium]
MTIPWLDIAISWRDILDIFLVTILLYKLILIAQGTRLGAALHGLLLVIILYLVTRPLGINTLSWILENFLSSLVLVVVILFQRDIRNVLTYMGSRKGFFFSSRKETNDALREKIAAAALYMAQRKIGALIVIEGEVPLNDVAQGGVVLNADITRELLVSIFWPGGPLHDGAVVIRGNKIASAGCILPLTTLVQGKQDYGTRHRAAIGATEETDAIAVVVSEERGVASIAVRGKLTGGFDAARLHRVLSSVMEKHA